MIKKEIIIFSPSIEGYGVEKNLFIISNYLVKKFQSVKLITMSNKYKNKFDKNIKFISLNNAWLNNSGRIKKYFFSSLLLIKNLFNKKNKIVLSFQANVFAVIISKIFCTKIIIRLNSSLDGIENIFVKKLLNFFYQYSDKVIVNSNDFKKEVYKKFKIKCECIYNPLNTNEIIKKSKKKINIFKKNSKLKIINIGRLVPQKNQILLLRAIKEIKDNYNFKIEVIIVGEGFLKNKLFKYIKEHHLSKIIKIVSFKSNPYPFIKSADLFLLTSLYEGLPNVLLEAKTLKTFIISSNCPTGPREILDEGKSGLLFKNNSLQDLVKKINLYVKNKKKYKMKANFYSKKLNKFSYVKNLKKYEKLLKNL